MRPALALLGFVTFAFLASLQPVDAADESQIKKLQQERLAALQKVVEFTDFEYKQGQLGFAERVQAYQELLKAELELCDNDAQRIKVCEKMLGIAKADEETAIRRQRAGEADSREPLRATARRLEIEIKLERLKK